MAVTTSVKKALQKVGVPIAIYKGKARIEEPDLEYSIIALSNQATKPFIRENYAKATLAFDSIAEAGDLVQARYASGRTIEYLIMNATVSQYKDEVATYESVFYRVNNLCSVYKEVPVYNNDTQKYDNVWTLIDEDHENIPCLLSGTRYGNEIKGEAGIGTIPLSQLVCYVSKYYTIEQGYRMEFDTGEKMIVDASVKYNYPNCYEITLEAESRG